jgi:DNA-binding response OmpR family regulator
MEHSRNPEAAKPLGGARVLVVEDDFLILMELEWVLRGAGAETLACRTVQQALARVDGEDIAAAILDVRLGSDSVAPVARELARRGVPFVFYTGQTANDAFIAEWPGCTIVSKPALPPKIVAALHALLK